MTITLRNATGERLQGEYPSGGQFDLPPGARATFSWDDLGLAKDPVNVRIREQFPARVEHLLALGCVEEGPVDGAPADLPQELPLSEMVDDEDGAPLDDPKSELESLDADPDD